eukprot:10503950-Lingulodinium_polyedra.AAC.1
MDASTERDPPECHTAAGTAVAESFVAASWPTDTRLAQPCNCPWAASPCGGDEYGCHQGAGRYTL